jgi:class 3 adenylate cyclase/tetratricopeptide (TPR) repeat protein
LAARAQASPRGVSDLERGKRTKPHLPTVRALADALGLSEPDRSLFLAAAQGAKSGPGLSDNGDAESQDTLGQIERQEQAGAAHSPPAAIHTFLIADIRGYTSFTAEHGDEAAARLATRFAGLAQEVVEAYGGRVVELRGDEALAVFVSARQALRAAVRFQARLAEETRVDPTLPLRVGIGLDAGEAPPVGTGYRGAALNLAARLCSLAGPGEVLASQTVAGVARVVDGLTFEDRGTVRLKGFTDPVPVIRVQPETQPDLVAGLSFEGAASGPQEAPSERSLPIGGFLGALPDTTLVAREAEMEQVIAAVDAAGSGIGRLVLISGEPGIGKTRLAQAVTVAARAKGFLVATGCCYEPEQAVAYYPFFETFQQAVTQMSASLRVEQPKRWAEVARLLPSQYGDPHAAVFGHDGRDDRLRLLWQATGFVQALTTENPVALLLDDLHWADSASLDLLQHLARHTRSDRLLVVGTFRDTEGVRMHSLDDMLRDLGREHLVDHLTLQRLSPADTRALVGSIIGDAAASDEFAQFLHQRTDGNPFFIHEILRDLEKRGDLFQRNGRWERRDLGEIDVPKTVRLVIKQRLAQLSVPAQRLLQEASVLGQAFTVDDLAGMSGRAVADLEQALDEAIAARLVREVGPEDCLFEHALIQQVLYSELSRLRKQRLHRAAGDAIERLSEQGRHRRDATLAWHYMAANEPVQTLPHALQAGDDAEAVYAHGEAERHFRLAAQLAAELGDTTREAEALRKLGAALCAQARYEDALAYLERSIDLCRLIHNADGLGRAAAEIGLLHAARGTPEQGVTRLQALLDTLGTAALAPPTRPAPGLAALFGALAECFCFTGRYQEQLAAADYAEDFARGLLNPGLLGQLQARRGSALVYLGRLEEAQLLLEQIIPRLDQAGDLVNESFGLHQLGLSYWLRGDFARDGRYAQRALEVAERTGDQALMVLMLMRCGFARFYSGAWKRAERDLVRSVDLARSIGASYAHPYALLGLAAMYLVQGNEEAGEALLQEGELLCQANGDFRPLRIAQAFFAERDLLRGHPAKARARIEPLLDRFGQEESDVTLLLTLIAAADLELGEEQQAGQVLAQIRRRVEGSGAQLVFTDAMRVEALLAIRQQRWDDAQALLDDVLALCRTMPYPWAEAKALYVYAFMLMQQGEMEQAYMRLEAARAILNHLGEQMYAQPIEQALAQMGGPVAAVGESLDER